MRKMVVWMLCCSAVLAWAGTDFKNVPALLEKSLGMHSVKNAAMEAGVLRVALHKTTLTELTYSTFIYHGICAEQWRSPEKFAKYGITRVEVLDAAGAAGFAFDGDAATCADMGQMGKNFGTFIGQRTSKCAAGQCAAGKRN